MKVELKDVLYDVNWERVLNKRKDGTIRKSYNGTNRINTLCHISIVDKNKIKSERYTELFLGKAYQNSKDIFNKAIGRKIALTKAIKDNFNKDERTVFWDFYKEKCKLR